jgi:hypothetical protein
MYLLSIFIIYQSGVVRITTDCTGEIIVRRRALVGAARAVLKSNGHSQRARER